MIQMGDIVAGESGQLMYVVARTTKGEVLCMWRAEERLVTHTFLDADLSRVPTVKDAAARAGLAAAETPDNDERRWYVYAEDSYEKLQVAQVRIMDCTIEPQGGVGRRTVPYSILGLTEKEAFERAERHAAKDVSLANECLLEARDRQDRIIKRRVRLYGGAK